MTQWIGRAISIGVLLAATAHASSGGELTAGASYKLATDSAVTVLINNNPDQIGAASTGSMVQIPAGSEFQVQELKQDASGQWLVHLNIGVDPALGVPSDFWAPVSELTRAEMEFVDFTVAPLTKGMTYCYAEVKYEAMRLGVCKVFPSGSEAWMGYAIMQRECQMHPVSYSASLPVGAVCFSAGQRMCGNHRCGHVMIKINRSTWYGAGYKAVPWVGAPKGCIQR